MTPSTTGMRRSMRTTSGRNRCDSAGFAAVTRFTDDLDVGFGGEHSCQARTNDGMVVGEKNANDRRHSGAPA